MAARDRQPARSSPWPPGFLRRFIASESAGGLVLMAAAALALVVANSPLGAAYFATLHRHLGPLSVLHWINDALMAAFFLLVGLEIKREAIEGQLSTRAQRVLPGVAALGGMAVPALVFVAVNAGSSQTLRGWAIPTATDIAFALGVVSLLGSRVPASLKVFLTALAIIDDLGAVILIAAVYTADLDLAALAGALAATGGLAALNRAGVMRLAPYLALGVLLWCLVLRSGVHATLAGVVLAMAVPLRIREPGLSPLFRLERAIQPWVAFAIVPLFGFANAGVSLAGFRLGALADPVPLGVAAGLFLGKQCGVFGAVRLSVAAGLAARPDAASWRQIYGVALLCGIGFTMSLFVGLLAFPNAPTLQDEMKLGVLLGSILSGLAGAAVLLTAPRRP